jgi:hypothetical protein
VNLSEAISRFRNLDEAKVQVGDYVTAPTEGHAWRGGYVTAIKGGKLSFQWSDHGDTKTAWIDVNKVTVNPGGPPR